jgi:pyruvate/2-oxoglutarate dehydrogenase complex dihydrolipoamide acyltransferase (E2) component
MIRPSRSSGTERHRSGFSFFRRLVDSHRTVRIQSHISIVSILIYPLRTKAMNGTSASSSSVPYDVHPFPPSRKLVVDAGELASKRHIIHGFVEVDVTEAQRIRHDLKKNTDTSLSFTAFLAVTLGLAVASDPKVQAYRDFRRWGKPLLAFHDVDVVVMIEPSKERGSVAVPHILRNVNKRTVQDVTEEIRNVQMAPKSSEQGGGKLVSIAPKLPRFVRQFFFRWMKRNPERLRQYQGTVMLTSVGMFGKGSCWGVPFLPLHTLGVTVGSISKKTGVFNDQITVREYLDLTISFDHDIVDGAPAARFTRTLVEMIEEAIALKKSAIS